MAREVVLGGRKVSIQRPRVRAEGREVALPTFQTKAATDPLHRRAIEQMLVGVATRQYARSLEPAPEGVTTRSTSKRAVSRRFVARTAAQLDPWRRRPRLGGAAAGASTDADAFPRRRRRDPHP